MGHIQLQQKSGDYSLPMAATLGAVAGSQGSSLMQAAQDYRTVEQAIHYLDAHFQRQPSLTEIADHVGLSEHHFQRLFSRWVGISPKRFLQYLTKEYAKTALDRSRSLLDASLDAGLSGPGRLHDLFVHCEAVTPGEYKSAGEGLTIRYGVHPTPFGEALLATTDKGICALNFVAGDGSNELDAHQAQWRSARFVRDDLSTGRLIEAIFAPSSDPVPLHLYIRGTNWQIKVWEALLRLPAGARATYGDIAQDVCTVKAARAVGNAVGSNPIAYLIPCHRVVRQNGGPHRYRWGSERKQAILAWEAAQVEKLAG